MLADKLNEFIAVDPIFFNNLGGMHLVVEFFSLCFAYLVAKITLSILCRIKTSLMLFQTFISVQCGRPFVLSSSAFKEAIFERLKDLAWQVKHTRVVSCVFRVLPLVAPCFLRSCQAFYWKSALRLHFVEAVHC